MTSRNGHTMGLIKYYQLSINRLTKSSLVSAFNVKPLQFLWPVTEVVDSLRKQREMDIKCVAFCLKKLDLICEIANRYNYNFHP